MHNKDYEYDLVSAKLTPKYSPKEDEKYMNEMQMSYFKRKLIDSKGELLAESINALNVLKNENLHEADLSDCATTETSISITIRVRERTSKLIEKIEYALQRIEEGTYGYCEESGEEIGIRRLEVRPLATLSLEAQERKEYYAKYHSNNDNEEASD